MNILDFGIIIFIIIGVILGFHRGFTKELVKTLGFIAVIVIAYFLKNPLSVFMYSKLPFFKFGILKNIEILNILVYEVIAFIICILLLSVVLKVVLAVTTIFEKILNATIILGIPSKLAGALVGALYHFIFVFIVLYVLSFTLIDNKVVYDSKFRQPILNNTPILSNFIDKSLTVVDEFVELKNKYSDKDISPNEFNYQAFELFLKYKVIKPESLEQLIADGKVESFDGCIDLILKYKGDKNDK